MAIAACVEDMQCSVCGLELDADTVCRCGCHQLV